MLACSKCEREVEVARAGPEFIESGDLAEIRKRGKLRILYPRHTQTGRLPRRGSSIDFELDLARDFARQRGLEPVLVYVHSRDELIPSLLAGRGDLIAANLTVTAERKESVAFTVPVAVVREQLVARRDGRKVDGPADLAGRKVAVRRSSSFWDTIGALRTIHPEIEIQEMPETVDTEEIIHRVAVGELDLTVADSNLMEAALEYREDVRAAFNLTADRSIAMAVRPASRELLNALDRYLTEFQLTARNNELHLGDLPEIKERRTLRVLTRNAAATYFLWRGELMGFEYELARAFAEHLGLRLEMIVPPDGQDLLAWLREGRGDIVAAVLTPTEERRRTGVEFSRPYNFVYQVVVSRDYETHLRRADDLAGRTFHVRRSSSYWSALEKLRLDGVPLELEAAPEELETEEIIAKVATGEYDLTLADSNVLDIELTWRDDVRAAFAIGETVPQAWAVRESNPELKAAIDAFVRKEYRGLFYNVIYDKYFENSVKIRRHVTHRFARTGDLSPYDRTVRKYAAQYGFDWRLIVAQMYQESRFDPQARSFAGAEGLMQILPCTAEELGITDIYDPEAAIHAGIKYLNWVRDRFEPELSVQDRMWFTLAGYNAGAGHVRDARRLAARQGLSPNQWFGNVERAMLLLSRSQYAQAAQHGYCRCAEPVEYVREIRERYNAYVDNSLQHTF